MIRIFLALIIAMTGFTAVCFPEPAVQFNVFNSSYVYNDENGNAWEQSQYTLTYMQDIFQPYFNIQINDKLSFKAGVGLLINFNQKPIIDSYYPYIQTKMNFGDTVLTVGSLDNNHNFPAPMMDPASGITPKIRVTNHNHITYSMLSNVAPGENAEFNPTLGEDTHGFYEYGGSYSWDVFFGKGELYMNWQELDVSNSIEAHRERFDVGLINTYPISDLLPLYTALHYWHNGGHETIHPVLVTENYTLAAGLRDTNYDVLYMASILYLDRDIPSMSIFGEAVYLDYHFRLSDWDIQPELFITDEWLNHTNHFISVEGDTFFNLPLYIGLNIYHNFYFDSDKTTLVQMGFVNGIYLGSTDEPFNWKNLRNDQLLRINFQYSFEIVKK